jgi:hypothetical protein
VFKIFCKNFNSVLISVLNRFQPHRPASTRSVKPHPNFVAYRMTFKVTIRIWYGWKWAKWVMIYATVTHSRISNHVHTELKPYRPGSTLIEPDPYGIKTVSTRFHPYWLSSTCIDPHRNTCQFLRILGATKRWRKHFGHVQNFCAFQTVYKSVLNPYRPGCKTLSHAIA